MSTRLTFTHPREVWQSLSEPVRSTNLFEWSDVTNVIVHYTADDDLPDGDVGEFIDDIPQYLRNMQHFYLTDPRRGYSVGYAAAIDWLGGSWELRGDDFECAANVGWNDRTVAFLFLTDGDDRPTELAEAEFRRLVGQSLAAQPNLGPLLPHRQIATSGTPCPGSGIMLSLAEGRLDPRTFTPPPVVPPPPPPPILTTLEAPMYIAKNEAGEFLIGNGLHRRKLKNERHARKVISRHSGETHLAPLVDWESKRQVTGLNQVTVSNLISDMGSLVKER